MWTVYAGCKSCRTEPLICGIWFGSVGKKNQTSELLSEYQDTWDTAKAIAEKKKKHTLEDKTSTCLLFNVAEVEWVQREAKKRNRASEAKKQIENIEKKKYHKTKNYFFLKSLPKINQERKI